MQTTQSVTCPLPGLEEVVITYNMMASEDEFETFGKSLGEDGQEAVFVAIENWPEKYGAPFSRKAPMAWRMWACKAGLELGMKAFLAEAEAAS